MPDDLPPSITAMRREVLVYDHGALIGTGWSTITGYYPPKITLVSLDGEQMENGRYTLEFRRDILVVMPTRIQ